VRTWLARRAGHELLTMGQALAVGCGAGLTRAGVRVWLSTSLIDLEVDGDRVIGVRVLRDGEPVTIRATRGVLLAAGGFEKNAVDAQAVTSASRSAPTGRWARPRTPATRSWLGQRLGAGLELMDDAWWGPSVPLPRGPYFLLAERTLPGCILVNAAGRRFVNEAAPYVDAVHAMYDAHTPEVPHIPAWLVFDQRYRNRYVFAARRPRQTVPGPLVRLRVAPRPDRWPKLAAEIGLPGDALAATVRRFNAMAETARTTTSTAASRPTTATTATPATGPTRAWPHCRNRRSTPSGSCPATSAPRAASPRTSGPECCARTARRSSACTRPATPAPR
jgi:3-oxosteroid 1-dehydrogenase